MAADANLLRGECVENPKELQIPVEEYALGFMISLLEENNFQSVFPPGIKGAHLITEEPQNSTESKSTNPISILSKTEVKCG